MQLHAEDISEWPAQSKKVWNAGQGGGMDPNPWSLQGVPGNASAVHSPPVTLQGSSHLRASQACKSGPRQGPWALVGSLTRGTGCWGPDWSLLLAHFTPTPGSL